VTRQLRRDRSAITGMALQVRRDSFDAIGLTPQLRRCNADGETLYGRSLSCPTS